MKPSIFQRIRDSYTSLDKVGRIVLFAFLGTGVITAVLAFNLVRTIVQSTTSFQLPG